MTRNADRLANPAFPLPPAAIYAGFANEQAYLDQVFKDAIFLGDYWLANARVSLMAIPFGAQTARISAYGRNIFDSKGRNYSVNVNTNIQSAYERPRQYGVEVAFSFVMVSRARSRAGPPPLCGVKP
ncbi:hypothetical protein AB5I41_14940 [Sphingomonas sp. MMS24-JH45]